jgi:hypothetical protein
MKNIYLGIKHALNVPSLPKKVSDFYNHIYTRIFRFIGGISILLLLTKAFEHIQLQNYFSESICEIINLTIIITATFFIIFTIIINSIKIVYTIYLFIKKPDTFEVRNSPLNIFATQIAKILTCMKIGCLATGSTAAVVAGGITFDTIIEKTGRAPIFIPLMAEGLNLILGKPVSISEINLPEVSSDTQDTLTISTDFNQKAINDALNKYQNLSVTEKNAFWSEVAKEFKNN